MRELFERVASELVARERSDLPEMAIRLAIANDLSWADTLRLVDYLEDKFAINILSSIGKNGRVRFRA